MEVNYDQGSQDSDDRLGSDRNFIRAGIPPGSQPAGSRVWRESCAKLRSITFSQSGITLILNILLVLAFLIFYPWRKAPARDNQ